MILNVLTFDIVQTQEIINDHIHILYQHMNQTHMQYIYQYQNQFEKIDGVELESYDLFRGDNTIEFGIVSLIDIQDKS